MKTLIALACLSVVACLMGCPTTNTPLDASASRDAPPGTDAPATDAPTTDTPLPVDAPTAPCMPGGTWAPGAWVADPSNGPGCVTPETTPLTFGADGVPVGSDGSRLMCPVGCDAMTCLVVPVAGPACEGSFRISRACSGGPGGTARFAIHGETADFEAELETTSGTCLFRTRATRTR